MQAGEQEEAPEFLSWGWWLLLASALAIWKYSARDWLVCKVGVAMLGIKYLFAQKLWMWTSVKAPWLTSAIKAAYAFVVGVSVATFEVLTQG